jgi:hypothetical protein
MEIEGGQVNDPVLRALLELGPLQEDRSEKVSELIGMDIDEYLDADARAHRIEPDVDASRGWKAMMLAPTIEICQALLANERVPWWKLNIAQAQRYGLRRRTTVTRVGLDDFNDVRA